jgi:poly(hydroxyalkanoate) granule-associated protein
MATGDKSSTKIPAAVGSAMYEVWLAGLGALAQAQKEGRKQFESLVQEGIAIQEKLRETAQNHFEAGARQMIEVAQAATEKATGTWEAFQGSVQEQLERAMSTTPGGAELQAFMKRLQAATSNLQSLAKWPGVGPAPAAEGPAARGAARKSVKKATKKATKKVAKKVAKRAVKSAVKKAARAPAGKSAKKKSAKKAAKHA